MATVSVYVPGGATVAFSALLGGPQSAGGHPASYPVTASAPWVQEIMRLCVHPIRVKSLFPMPLGSPEQVPLAFKAKWSGNSASWAGPLSLASLDVGLRPPHTPGEPCNCNYPCVCGSAHPRVCDWTIVQLHSCYPPLHGSFSVEKICSCRRSFVLVFRSFSSIVACR